MFFGIADSGSLLLGTRCSPDVNILLMQRLKQNSSLSARMQWMNRMNSSVKFLPRAVSDVGADRFFLLFTFFGSRCECPHEAPTYLPSRWLLLSGKQCTRPVYACELINSFFLTCGSSSPSSCLLEAARDLHHLLVSCVLCLVGLWSQDQQQGTCVCGSKESIR